MHTPRTAAEATSTVSGASPTRRRPCQRLQLMQRLSLTDCIKAIVLSRFVTLNCPVLTMRASPEY